MGRKERADSDSGSCGGLCKAATAGADCRQVGSEAEGKGGSKWEILGGGGNVRRWLGLLRLLATLNWDTQSVVVGQGTERVIWIASLTISSPFLFPNDRVLT